MSKQHKKENAAKVETAQTLWGQAVIAHGGFGRWVIVEVQDPCECGAAVRAACVTAQSVAIAGFGND